MINLVQVNNLCPKLSFYYYLVQEYIKFANQRRDWLFIPSLILKRKLESSHKWMLPRTKGRSRSQRFSIWQTNINIRATLFIGNRFPQKRLRRSHDQSALEREIGSKVRKTEWSKFFLRKKHPLQESKFVKNNIAEIYNCNAK